MQVVGRRGWVEAYAARGNAMLGDAADQRPPSEWNRRERVLARVNGFQFGLGLGLLARRIVGQFQPFGTPTLILVAPNFVATEESLGVVAADYRRWMCVHEQTHQLQFAAAPWLTEYLRAQFVDALVGARDGQPQQHVAVMSLLEGYADTMMDRLDPRVVPSIADLRHRLSARRQTPGPDAVVRAALGLDAKFAQYTEGAAFCAAVLRRADLATLNRAFAGPELLPSYAELRDPARWLRRVGR